MALINVVENKTQFFNFIHIYHTIDLITISQKLVDLLLLLVLYMLPQNLLLVSSIDLFPSARMNFNFHVIFYFYSIKKCYLLLQSDQDLLDLYAPMNKLNSFWLLEQRVDFSLQSLLPISMILG